MKGNNLSNALASASGSTRKQPIPEIEATDNSIIAKKQPSRVGTVPITGHFPEEVRKQLKILAITEGKTVQLMMAEALNELFAKYGKPEIAPKGDD